METIQARPLTTEEFYPFATHTNVGGNSDAGTLLLPPSPVLTKLALAEMLACSERQIEKLVAAGDIPRPFFLGDSPRWLRTWINEFLTQLQPGDRLGGKAQR